MKSTRDPSIDSQHEACEASFVCQSGLDEIVRKGGQCMLAEVVEAEVEQYVREHFQSLDSNGHRLIVRNGNMSTC